MLKKKNHIYIYIIVIIKKITRTAHHFTGREILSVSVGIHFFKCNRRAVYFYRYARSFVIYFLFCWWPVQMFSFSYTKFGLYPARFSRWINYNFVQDKYNNIKYAIGWMWVLELVHCNWKLYSGVPGPFTKERANSGGTTKERVLSVLDTYTQTNIFFLSSCSKIIAPKHLAITSNICEFYMKFRSIRMLHSADTVSGVFRNK